MEVVILCGGRGTRISEITNIIPKPLIELEGKPLVHHIMDTYMIHGLNDFILPVGYKGFTILAYFMSLNPDSVSMDDGVSDIRFPSFRVRVVETGLETMTGGRLGRIRKLITGDSFHMTYGDGLSNVDIGSMESRGIANLTLVHPSGRFGRASLDEDGKISVFGEKVEGSYDLINGGFSVLSSKIFDYIPSDSTNLEKDVYPNLAYDGELFGRVHDGFWHCVDSVRDLESLHDIYEERGAVWLRS